MMEISVLAFVVVLLIVFAAGAFTGILVYRNNLAKLARVADAVDELKGKK